jgi:RNA polymerase sigma factor (sigma-70 family)
MSQARRSPILHYLRRLLGAPEPAGVTDAELLRRFVAERDEAAFELLLWRHGTAVLNLCRHVLHDEHAAEDAFQATFLVLLRKAGSIGRREALAGWLHRVAYRVALRARGRGAKRAAREVQGTDLSGLPAPASGEDATARELRRVLYEEVDRLPAKYRAPVVLCYFEARTHEEAAQELAWAKGTVAGRLARAREMLRERLARRGITLATTALSAALAPSAAPAAGLAVVISSTIQAAKLPVISNAVVAGVLSDRAAALVEGALQAMFWTRLKITAAALLAVGIAGAGAAGLMRGGFTAGPDDRPQAQKPAEPARKPGEAAKEPVDPAQLARDRGQSRVNLRNLALAMRAYHGAHDQFPMPAVYGKDGKPLLSWRVLLLPYLGQDDLYKRFQLDEPWDGPHNKKLLKEMPKVYAPPGVTTPQPYSTFYQVFVGGGAVFEGKKGTRITDITDGSSNTVLLVEAGKAVPWTKPEDLEYAADRPVPSLGGLFPQVFHAALADGSVVRLRKDFDERTMRFAITRDGGEVFVANALMARLPVPGADPRAEARYVAKLAGLSEENVALQQELREAADQARVLRAERELLQERTGLLPKPGDDAEAVLLTKENEDLRRALRRRQEDIKQLQKEIRRLNEEAEKQAPEKARK